MDVESHSGQGDKSGGFTDMEGLLSPEQQNMSPWQTKIILSRHTEYTRGLPERPGELTDEERKLGHTTLEGREKTRETTSARVNQILDEAGPSVDFMVVTSPALWMDNPELGARAVETANSVAVQILRSLHERGLKPNQLVNLSPEIEGELAKPEAKIEEAQIFVPPFEFTNTLREANGGQGKGFWSDWVTERYQQLQQQTGAESPATAASRLDSAIDDVAQYGSHYSETHPGRKLAVFMISHSEMLEALAHHQLDRPGEEFGYNDAFEIDVSRSGNIEVHDDVNRGV